MGHQRRGSACSSPTRRTPRTPEGFAAPLHGRSRRGRELERRGPNTHRTTRHEPGRGRLRRTVDEAVLHPDAGMEEADESRCRSPGPGSGCAVPGSGGLRRRSRACPAAGPAGEPGACRPVVHAARSVDGAVGSRVAVDAARRRCADDRRPRLVAVRRVDRRQRRSRHRGS